MGNRSSYGIPRAYYSGSGYPYEFNYEEEDEEGQEQMMAQEGGQEDAVDLDGSPQQAAARHNIPIELIDPRLRGVETAAVAGGPVGTLPEQGRVAAINAVPGSRASPVVTNNSLPVVATAVPPFVSNADTFEIMEDIITNGSQQARNLCGSPFLRPFSLRSVATLDSMRNASRPGYQAAMAGYVVGKVEEAECTRCGRGNGPFSSCVTVENYFKGACTNCIYQSRGKECSLRGAGSGEEGADNGGKGSKGGKVVISRKRRGGDQIDRGLTKKNKRDGGDGDDMGGGMGGIIA